jgi:hypothetical protein
MIQRHPKVLISINPPMNGAAKGPINTAMQKTDITIPRWALLNKSAKTAGTTEIGLAAKSPAKNRHIMIVCKSFAVAHATVKMPHPRIPTESGPRLPISSEPGAQMVGPAANPRT